MRRWVFWSIALLWLAGTALGAPRSAVPPDRAANHIHAPLLPLVGSAPDRTVNAIVQKEGPGEGPERFAVSMGGTITHRWQVINGFAVRIPAGTLARLAGHPGVRWISADSRVHPAGTSAVSSDALKTVYPLAVRADKAWQEGYSGAGVRVALVDSGISTAANRDLDGRVVANVVVHPAARDAVDRFGHGTHVAGIIAGRSSSGQYLGIAPHAELVNVKVSDDTGAGSESDLISALDWIYINRKLYNIRVVNISVSASVAQSYDTSPLCAAVERLWREGVVVVVAAGNRGDAADAVWYPPANDPFVLTVGAVDDMGTKTLGDDSLAAWSSYGQTQDGYPKPEVVAPGSAIVSMLAGSETVLAQAYPENIERVRYFRLGGTSMSSPVVAGAAAVLLQAHPGLTPDQVKWLLMETARGYRYQPPGTASVIDLQRSLGYLASGQPLGSANQGTPVSASLDPVTGTISASNYYWTNYYWTNYWWNHAPDY